MVLFILSSHFAIGILNIGDEMRFFLRSDIAIVDNSKVSQGIYYDSLDSAMVGLQQNAPGALEYVYEHARKAVFYCAYSVLHDKGLAEDIMQETFIRVNQYATSYVRGSKPLAWITTMARNLALNELTKRKREMSTDFGEVEVGGYSISDNGLLLEQAFKCLNEQERQIVILHAVTGMKHREIASMLELPLGTVLYKYSFALKKLKKTIQEVEIHE